MPINQSSPLPKFEIGQIVKCVDALGIPLILGGLYEVASTEGELVTLIGDEPKQWFAERFEPVDPLVESILEIQKKNA
jgi:hypothetical protein